MKKVVSIVLAMFSVCVASGGDTDGSFGRTGVKTGTPAGLLHRWSFNGDLTDSVGGQTATVHGNVTTDGSAYITQYGESGSSYISLGSDVLPPGDSEATIELWGTRTTDFWSPWCRIFEIGDIPDGFTFTPYTYETANGVKNESTNSVYVCWFGNVSGGHLWTPEYENITDWVELNADDMDVEYHIAVVYKRVGATWEISYYCLDTKGNVIGRDSIEADADWSPADIGRSMCVLGQALTGWDYNAGAKYNEFRVWGKALTEDELVANDRTGPDNPGTDSYNVSFYPGEGASGYMAPVTVDDNTYYTLPPCGFTRDGYTFAGWQINDACYNYLTPPVHEAGHSYGPACGNLELTATWTADGGSGDEAPSYCLWDVEISFKAGGGFGNMAPVTVAANLCDNNTYYALPGCEFIRPGYTFAGWRVKDYCTNFGGDESSLPIYGAYDSYGPLCGYLELTATWAEADLGEIHTASANGLTWKYVVVNGAAMLFGGKHLEWDTEEGRYKWEYDTAIPRNTSGAITIPPSLDGYPVTAIGDGAFTECEGLTSVTIPSGVVSIGEDAFSDCDRLTSVSLPEGLFGIGKEAFEECALSSLTLPQSLQAIGDGAFGYCSRLRSVAIPESVQSIGYRAFQRCSSMRTAYVPDHLYSQIWDNEVFYQTSVDITLLNADETPPTQTALQPWTAKKAVTLHGAVYDSVQDLAGIVELKVAKPNAKKRNVKVSGSVTLLDGKKRAFKAVTVPCDGSSTIRAGNFTAKGLGAFSIEIGADGFTGGNGTYTMQDAEVGGKWTHGAGVNGGWSDEGNLPAGTLTELLPDPDNAELKPKGGRWAFAKPAKVKWGKLKTGGVGLTVDTAGGKTNLSAMKLAYTPKTGVFKGSFKIYAVQNNKLKRFTVKVFGFVVGEVGYGRAMLAKPKTSWWLQVD